MAQILALLFSHYNAEENGAANPQGLGSVPGVRATFRAVLRSIL
jgi:hypothetical protein